MHAQNVQPNHPVLLSGVAFVVTIIVAVPGVVCWDVCRQVLAARRDDPILLDSCPQRDGWKIPTKDTVVLCTLLVVVVIVVWGGGRCCYSIFLLCLSGVLTGILSRFFLSFPKGGGLFPQFSFILDILSLFLLLIPLLVVLLVLFLVQTRARKEKPQASLCSLSISVSVSVFLLISDSVWLILCFISVLLICVMAISGFLFFFLFRCGGGLYFLFVHLSCWKLTLILTILMMMMIRRKRRKWRRGKKKKKIC